MSRFDDFRRGDRVAHITLGDGVVTEVNDTVHVVYHQKVAGRLVHGTYDRRWFDTNPKFLSHRSEQP